MANEESPILQDIFLNSTDFVFDNNEDYILPFDWNDFTLPSDFESLPSPSDLFSLSNSEEELTSIDMPRTDLLVYSNTQPSIVSLSFINPPETVYHVRYVSEITSSPLHGNMINVKNNTKKNLSGRYLKGERGRHISIALPSILSYNLNLYIRVTRLTVPYQDVSFIHPYPLLYSKKKIHSHVILQGASIYYKISKEELCSHSKSFANLILTRLKQCQLKLINNLQSFDPSEASRSLVGNNAKSKIRIYQLKKSQLDFRIVIKCEEPGEFIDTNIFCRSNELLEEEGIDSKKSSR